MSGPLRSLWRMSILIPARVTAFMRVEFATDGHPEFDRAITLPQSAPMEWIVDAYLLSIGQEPLGSREFDDDPDDYWERPRMLTIAETAERWRGTMPVLDHRPDITVRAAEAPPLGAPLVSVGSSTAPPAVLGDWLTQTAPFREDDVNRELMRRYGVVTPYFDELDLRGVAPGVRRSSRLDTLLSALTPARRLALLAHIDAADLLQESVPDRATTEAAVVPLAALVRHLGGSGVAQDPVTGWIPDVEVARFTRSLEWQDGIDQTRARGDVVIAFAQRAKLIGRLKGRVVATAYARRLTEPTRGTLASLAAKIGTPTRERFGVPLPRRDAEAALALLAVADGSVNHLDDLANRVAAGAVVLDATDSIFGSDRFDMMFATHFGHDVGDKGEEMGRLIDDLASLSAPRQFGVITPAMREVARCALV